MQEKCEHGNPMDEACDKCDRHDDGSDGSMAGEHRAAVKRWQAYLKRQEEERRELWGEQDD